jgi:hypothetical protein
MKSTRRLLYSAAVGTGPICCGGARAEDWKVTGEFGWFAVGKAQEIEKGHSYWVGEYAGTFFNDKHAGVKCPSWFDSDTNNKKAKAGGYCIITDVNGDQAYLTWQGSGTPGGPLSGTFQYTGGTGKYQGIGGDNTFVGVTQVNWKDGTSSGYATWNR